jgi:hypothetical protein
MAQLLAAPVLLAGVLDDVLDVSLEAVLVVAGSAFVLLSVAAGFALSAALAPPPLLL